MKLSDSDLQQLDPAWALGLGPVQKDKLLVTLIDDLKEARERLGANSQNSSRPPRTNAPWESVAGTETKAEESQTSNALKDTGNALKDTHLLVLYSRQID